MTREFGVHRIEFISDDRAAISGRVFNGIVTLGTRFVTACNVRYFGPEKSSEILPVSQINLIVDRIVLYGIEVPELDPGLTGVIEVAGSGLYLIRPEMILLGEA